MYFSLPTVAVLLLQLHWPHQEKDSLCRTPCNVHHCILSHFTSFSTLHSSHTVTQIQALGRIARAATASAPGGRGRLGYATVIKVSARVGSGVCEREKTQARDPLCLLTRVEPRISREPERGPVRGRREACGRP